MPEFSVLLLTAPPPGQITEAGGAFVKIDGRESLLRAVELFLNRDNIKQIQLAVSSDFLDEAKQKFGGHLSFSGVKLVSSPATNVILHDAARPAVSYADIDALTEAAEKHAAVALTSPLRAAIIELDEGHNPIATHLSNRYVQLLTPQAFTRQKFMEIAKSKQDIHASALHLLKGSPLNVRLSGSGDAALVKQMINMLPKPKLKAPSSPFEEAQW